MIQRLQASRKRMSRRMGTHVRAGKQESTRARLLSAFALCAVFALCVVLACSLAMPRAARAQAKTAARSDFGADKQTLREDGVRLEGHAFINRPELQVRADVIALDYDQKKIQQVRAVGRVNFKMDLPPRDGGAPAHVEATSNNATLDPATRTLVLIGSVDGFYQIKGGGRNSLRGERATLIYPQSKQLSVDLEGGTRGVTIVVPAETFNKSTAIGTVTVTAQRARIRGAQNTATFTGNARAVSNDGPSKFDITAPEFVISRGAGDTIDTLKTTGRTLLKIDLPPDTSPDAATPATPNATANPNAEPNRNNLSRPTHMEVSSDALTMNRSDNTMVFDGRVDGFYRLRPAGAPASDYNFNGDRATVRYAEPKDPTVPASASTSSSKLSGLQVELSGEPGKPSVTQLPAFDLGF